MGKVRVYSLAQELDVKSTELLDMLKEMGQEVQSHMSTIEDDVVEILRNRIKGKGAAEVKPEQKQETKKADEPVKAATNHQEAKIENKPARQEEKPQHNKDNKQEVKNNNHKDNARNGNAQNANRQMKDNNNGGKNKHNNNKQKNNHPPRNESKFAHAEVAEEVAAVEQNNNIIEVQLPLTVKGLAELLKVAPNALMGKLIGLGIMATINQNLDRDTIEILAADFDKEIMFKSQEEQIKARVIEDRAEDMQSRPPIVTIMGHVDHGKTSLLDVIRQTNVTATEAGGITQHIGAYQTTINGKKITFLDTPGHEAFTAMRARGAQATDIAILVVAADDGVMPQTIEAINHAKAAGIQLIVAVNKIDKDNANPDRVLQELTEHGLIAEAWGGETICVNVSALKKQNIDNLLEMILLVAEMQELKANPNRPAEGLVVEAELDKGRGPIATVLVKRGTLRIGDPIIAGPTFGRVRAMINDKGERVEKATPSTPVVVLGLNDVPSAGDVFEAVDDDKTARSIAEERADRKRVEELTANRGAISLDDLFKQIKEGEVKDLNIIIKADVQGSIEALRDSLLRLSTEEVRVMPLHTGVGAITETDVMLASASNAIIIGFNVRPDLNARRLSEAQKVEIRTYRVIYQAIDEVKLALEGLLEPEQKEVVTGRAEVRAVFKVPKVGVICGLYVTDGKINRNSKVRLLRNGVVIHEGKIGSLKRFQDDVREVAQGYECGLGIEGYNDVKEGDEMEVFVIEEVRRTLD